MRRFPSIKSIKNIDEAFKRRMKFIIDFPFPGKKERLELWKRAIPEAVPRGEELDLAFLAERFELSGSNIRNIVYHACFWRPRTERTEVSACGS